MMSKSAAALPKTNSVHRFFPVVDSDVIDQASRGKLYQDALHAFQKGSFAEAKLVIQQIKQVPDTAEQYLEQRIQQALEENDNEDRIGDPDWNGGVNMLDSKNF